jgi:hypothetical protein
VASTKRLSSVCHSIAHHAASGLSFIHPHLRQAWRQVGIVQVVIDLTRDDPYPAQLRSNEPLRLALIHLRKKAEGILSAEGFTQRDIEGLDLHVSFSSSLRDDYCSDCYVILKHRSGRVFEDGVNELGERVRKLDQLDDRQ